MKQRNHFNLYLAQTAGMLSGARRVAMLLLLTLLTMTAQTAWASSSSSAPAGRTSTTAAKPSSNNGPLCTIIDLNH